MVICSTASSQPSNGCVHRRFPHEVDNRKFREKRLDQFAQRGVDQPTNDIKPAAEARKQAQFVREKPQPRHSGHENLIGMQNGITNERRAGYLGNVGLIRFRGVTCPSEVPSVITRVLWFAPCYPTLDRPSQGLI